jgi:hypothetical protein
MARFITIGYGDRAGYDQTHESVRNSAHEHDQLLRARGALVGTAGEAVQVRNPDAKGVQTAQGAFMQSDLPVAGFAVIDAANIEEAVTLVAQTPCAVARGVVEVWPLEVA